MEEMTQGEVVAFASQNRFGVLSLAHMGRAYAVPLFYGFDGRSFYFHTHPGLKTTYMMATEEACFTVARVVTEDDWGSIEAFGRVEPIEAGPALTTGMNALMSSPLPPEWGFTQDQEPKRGDHGMRLYRLTPTRVTGRKSVRPRLTKEDIAHAGM